ncbi:Mu-like prophage major head subunit gpT family protein [Oceaniradius stylonematis]|uniref:Mu-like prophage major head subunit gpT family protein n=1 Tax=Oceaniradius stylonematis TaxID=2184161 RepID=UPI00273EB8B7|nr:Mu-like prophage major head subunit gpT family protein [Oceaniradius stylonematis]
MDINRSTMTALFTGLSTAFNGRLEATTAYYQHVAMTVNSTTAANQYPRMDDLPGFREWIGDRVVHDLSMQAQIIVNKEYEKTIGVKRSQIEDDQLGFLSQTIGGWGQDSATFPDELVFPLLKSGETSVCYDGQYFFDTDHPGYDENGAEISVSNVTAGAATPWYLVDDSQVVKPLIYQTRKPFKLTAMDAMTDENVFHKGRFEYGIDGRAGAGYGLWQTIHKSRAVLNADNYAAVRAAMMGIRRRDGRANAIRPTKLLVPPTLEQAGRKLLEAEFIDGGDSNIWKGTAELVVIPDLA